MQWRNETRADMADSRHFDSKFPSDHQADALRYFASFDKPAKSRNYFGGAILLLWVVAFAAVCFVWEVLA